MGLDQFIKPVSFYNQFGQNLMSTLAGDFDFLLKLVVIGDSGVGKTNLLSRFSSNQFSHQSKPTIGVEFATRSLDINNFKIKAQIWDTAGQQRFRAITHAYYKGATGALLVFDITRRSSYDNLPKWLKQLRQNADENIVCILVGENILNSSQNRSIRQEEVAEFAQQNKLFYLETSALESTNVDQAFMTVIKQIYENLMKKDRQSGTKITTSPALNRGKIQNTVTLQNESKQQSKNKKKKKKCCE